MNRCRRRDHVALCQVRAIVSDVDGECILVFTILPGNEIAAVNLVSETSRTVKADLNTRRSFGGQSKLLQKIVVLLCERDRLKRLSVEKNFDVSGCISAQFSLAITSARRAMMVACVDPQLPSPFFFDKSQVSALRAAAFCSPCR